MSKFGNVLNRNIFWTPRCLFATIKSRGGALHIFWVRGRAIGKGIYFLDIGIKNSLNYHNFGIMNGADFLDFGMKYKVGYTFLKNWYKVGYTFLKNWHKVGNTFSKTWYKEWVRF